MKVSELLYEADVQSNKLIQVLRTVIASADQKGTGVFLHFSNPSSQDIQQGIQNLDLNKIMQNVGGEQFDYGTFKASYDTDPRVKSMIKNFSEKGIELKTKADADNTPQQDAQGDNTVSQMAKSATNLGDKL